MMGTTTAPEDGAGENAEETLEERSAALELENQELRETVGAQAKELEVLRRWVVELGERAKTPVGDDAVAGGQGHQGDCRPPRRSHGMLDAEVVTLEEESDEERAFGPAASLVADWREMGQWTTG